MHLTREETQMPKCVTFWSTLYANQLSLLLVESFKRRQISNFCRKLFATMPFSGKKLWNYDIKYAVETTACNNVNHGVHVYASVMVIGWYFSST